MQVRQAARTQSAGVDHHNLVYLTRITFNNNLAQTERGMIAKSVESLLNALLFALSFINLWKRSVSLLVREKLTVRMEVALTDEAVYEVPQLEFGR